MRYYIGTIRVVASSKAWRLVLTAGMFASLSVIRLGADFHFQHDLSYRHAWIHPWQNPILSPPPFMAYTSYSHPWAIHPRASHDPRNNLGLGEDVRYCLGLGFRGLGEAVQKIAEGRRSEACCCAKSRMDAKRRGEGNHSEAPFRSFIELISGFIHLERKYFSE